WPPAPVKERAGEPAKNATVEDVPALPASEDVTSAMDHFWMQNHIHSAGADDSAQKEPGRQLVDDVGIDFLSASTPNAHQERCRTREQDHDAVAVNLDVPDRNLEEDRPHPCVPRVQVQPRS